MNLPFDLSYGAAAYMAVAVLVAAFVRGYSGFGFSALVISASALVTNPLYFVAVVMFCEFLMTFQQWGAVRQGVEWRRVWALMAGALIGLPLGLWGINMVGVDVARAIIAGYVLFMCGVLMLGWQIRRPQGVPEHIGVGTFAGAANAVGMAGLPVATYFTAQGVSAAVFRGTLVAYFCILDLFSTPLMWWHGMVTWDTPKAVALALPIMAFGIWAGGRHFLATDPQDFRKFAIGLLAVLAVVGLLKSVI
ncbi:MAG: sulfite exporter TauE/SafE family protein [Paracoccaceae bacterium]